MLIGMLIYVLTNANWSWLVYWLISWRMLTDTDVLVLVDADWCTDLHADFYWLMLIDAGWCWLMLIDIDWCWLMLTGAHWCWLVLDTDRCWLMLVVVCPHMRAVRQEGIKDRCVKEPSWGIHQMKQISTPQFVPPPKNEIFNEKIKC